MILLVIGLVAVIVVVLIAVFLSIRLGRGDEHDEADLESSGRDRRRHQDEYGQDADAELMSSSGSRGGRGSGYSGYDPRGPVRDRGPRGRSSAGAPGRPAREGSGYRKPAAARSTVGASTQGRGRHDTVPPQRPAVGDFPSADYPSMDLGPAVGYATGDQPAVATGYEAVDDSMERPAPRRKAAPASASGKSRSRQRGKRVDDDDWPSSEWDKLSDEQYWAELSADKPLSTKARSSRPVNNGAAMAPANGRVKAKTPMRVPHPARPATAGHDAQRDLPGRREHSDEREPATERLPVRTARQAAPSLPPSRQEAEGAAGRSYPDSRSVLDSGPWPLGDTGPLSVRNGGPRAVPGTGPLPLEPRRDTAGRQHTGDRDLAAVNGLAGAPPPIPGALEEDPLTSPSFSLRAVPARDGRSYGSARKHAKPAPDHFAIGHGYAGHGNGSSGHPVDDYAGPRHNYQPAAHAAPPAAADWYSLPPAPVGPRAEAQTSAYGNPYARTGSGNGASVAAHADSQATGSYSNYLTDPLQGYSPTGYQASAPYTEPARSASSMAAPPSTGSVPYADGYPVQPYTDQAGYQDGYSTGGDTHRYDSGY